MLSQSEIEFVNTNRKKGGFLREAAMFKPETKGVVFVSCGDGNRFRDVFVHLLTRVPFAHPVVLNGGSLWLSGCLPDPEKQGEVMKRNILETVWLKNFKTVVLASHWPCAIAKTYSLTIADVAHMTALAAIRLKSTAHDLTVIPELHVDFGTARELPKERRWNSYWLNPMRFPYALIDGQISLLPSKPCLRTYDIDITSADFTENQCPQVAPVL